MIRLVIDITEEEEGKMKLECRAQGKPGECTERESTLTTRTIATVKEMMRALQEPPSAPKIIMPPQRGFNE